MAGDPIAGAGFCAEEFHDLVSEVGADFSVPEASVPEIPVDNPLDHYSEVEQKCLIDAPKPGFRPVATCREATLDMSFDPRYRENHPCALKQRLSKDKDQQEQGQLYVHYVVKELKDPSIVAIALKGEVEGLSEEEQKQLQIIVLSDLQLIDIKGSVTEQVVFEFIQETSDPEMKQLAVAAILKVDVPPSPAQEKCFVSPEALIAEVAQVGYASSPIVLGVAQLGLVQTDDGLGNFQDPSALALHSAAMGTLPEREEIPTRTTGVAGPADNRGVDSAIMIGAAGGISDTASMPPKTVVIEFNPAQRLALLNAASKSLESAPLVLASSGTVGSQKDAIPVAISDLTQFLTTLQGVDPQLQKTVAQAIVGLLQTEGALVQNPQGEGARLQLVISWGEARTVVSDGVHVPTKTGIEIALVKYPASGGISDGTHASESLAQIGLPDRVTAGSRHSTLGGRRPAALPGVGFFAKGRSREEEIGSEVVFIGVPIQQLIRLTEKMEESRVSQFAKDSTSHQRGATEVARDGDTADRHGRGSSDQNPSDGDQDDEYAFYDDEDFEDSDDVDNDALTV